MIDGTEYGLNSIMSPYRDDKYNVPNGTQTMF